MRISGVGHDTVGVVDITGEMHEQFSVLDRRFLFTVDAT